MAVTECAIKYTVSDLDSTDAVAIIVCGGSSARMNGIDKIFADINGMPVAARSIAAFHKCSQINSIVVVTKDESILKMQQLCDKYAFTKVTDIVSGGRCRQESVLNGLNCLNKSTRYVLIHDGARPLVSEECIINVLKGAEKYSAVTCATPLKDTVKSIKADGLVVDTPERSSLVSVQTPQGFDFTLYRSCVTQKAQLLDTFTDDCSIVEACGYPVYTVKGDYSNIKITTLDDLILAEALLKNGV